MTILMPEAADELLAWCGSDVERLHEAYFAELARHPAAQRPVVLVRLRDGLGWPLPDTPVEEVLTYAGTPGLPLARVMATEATRPPRWRREELLGQLRARGLGPHATSVIPPPTGLFR